MNSANPQYQLSGGARLVDSVSAGKGRRRRGDPGRAVTAVRLILAARMAGRRPTANALADPFGRVCNLTAAVHCGHPRPAAATLIKTAAATRARPAAVLCADWELRPGSGGADRRWRQVCRRPLCGRARPDANTAVVGRCSARLAVLGLSLEARPTP